MTGPLALGAKAPLATTKMKNAVDGKMLSHRRRAARPARWSIFTCNHCPFAKGWEQRIAELGNDLREEGDRRHPRQRQRPGHARRRTAWPGRRRAPRASACGPLRRSTRRRRWRARVRRFRDARGVPVRRAAASSPTTAPSTTTTATRQGREALSQGRARRGASPARRPPSARARGSAAGSSSATGEGHRGRGEGAGASLSRGPRAKGPGPRPSGAARRAWRWRLLVASPGRDSPRRPMCLMKNGRATPSGIGIIRSAVSDAAWPSAPSACRPRRRRS